MARLAVEILLQQRQNQAGHMTAQQAAVLLGAINIHNSRFVPVQILKDIPQIVFPAVFPLPLCQQLFALVHQRPFQQIVNILKVIIKRFSADLGFVDQVLYGDFVQLILNQQLLERNGQLPFGQVGHSSRSFPVEIRCH